MDKEEQKQIFSQRLRECVKKKQINQKEIAEELGINYKAFNAWCRGLSIPKYEALISLSKYFGVNADWLIGKHAFKTLGQGGWEDAVSSTIALREYIKWNGFNIEVVTDSNNEQEEPLLVGYNIKNKTNGSVVYVSDDDFESLSQQINDIVNNQIIEWSIQSIMSGIKK